VQPTSALMGMHTVVFDGCGLIQQTSLPICPEAIMAQGWFKHHNKEFEVLTWCLNSSGLISVFCRMCWKTHPIPGGSTS
ncbi:hypothetical protein CRENBAI_004228, partial [Crenichthys baileyi]